jgi:hypothetical protein
MVNARGSCLEMVVKILYPDLDIEFSITLKDVVSGFMCVCNNINSLNNLWHHYREI